MSEKSGSETETPKKKSAFQSLHETYARELGRVGADGFEEYKPAATSRVTITSDIVFEEEAETEQKEESRKEGRKWIRRRDKDVVRGRRRSVGLVQLGAEKETDKDEKGPERTELRVREVSAESTSRERESLRSVFSRLKISAKMRIAALQQDAEGSSGDA